MKEKFLLNELFYCSTTILHIAGYLLKKEKESVLGLIDNRRSVCAVESLNNVRNSAAHMC